MPKNKNKDQKAEADKNSTENKQPSGSQPQVQPQNQPDERSQQLRISERVNKGNPPRKYGFSNDTTPFVHQDSGNPSTYTDLNITDFNFQDNTLYPQSESTIIENLVQSTPIAENTVQSAPIADNTVQSAPIAEIRNMFREFQINMMQSLNIRDDVLHTEINNIKKGFDTKFDGMMNIIKVNNNEIESLKQNHQGISNPIHTQRIHTPTSAVITNKQNYENKVNDDSELDNVIPTIDLTSRKKLHDLPQFDGKPEDWPLFVTSFNETTKAFSYTNLDNSMRLRKCLYGSALDTVKAMMIHPDNVPNIIEELKFRFGRPELLVKSQIQKIRQIACIKDEDLSGLINFSTTMKNLVSFLQNAEAEQFLQNPTLLEEILNKLPLQRRLDWAEEVISTNRLPSLADFSSWLSCKARIVSLIEVTTNPIALSKNKSTHKTAMVASEVKSSNPKCNYCQETHYVNQCSKFNGLSVSQRWDWVKTSSVCFCCLRKGHRLYDCRNQRRCNINGCNSKHHSLLHEVSSNINQTAIPSKSIEKPIVLNMHQLIDKVYFRVVPVTLYGRNKQVNVFALLDEGSSMTIMEKGLMDELDLNCKATSLTMQWLNDGIATEDTKVADCYIRGINEGCQKYKLKNVYAWSNLQLPSQTLNTNELISKYPQLQGIGLQSFEDAKPRLLIGLDNCRLGFSKTWIDCSPSGPVAVETALGWVLYGPSTNQPSSKNHLLLIQSSFETDLRNKYDKLNEIVKCYYELENFGVKKPDKLLQSAEISHAQETLKSTTVYKGDHFETGLLWKSDNIQMPKSYNMALSRLHNLEKKMSHDSDYHDKYCAAMRSFLEKQYARKLSSAEKQQISNKTWYLPHFGVSNAKKPEKIRLVFDAAAAVGNISLNSQLTKGPDLNRPLMSVLSQFRENPIAVCADIEEMFCQIKINPDDRQAQRFLWRDGDVREPIAVYEMTSMIFGASSSPTTAQYVKNINADRFASDLPDAVNAIKQNHYVDDFVMSFENEEQAIRISSQVKNIHISANFNLRNFISNSTKVLQALEPSRSCHSVVNFNLDSDTKNDKVLGMFWRSASDEFVFDFKFDKIPQTDWKQFRAPTKREVLSMTMSIFDPFGFIANFHIFAKILLQTLWNLNLSWDDELPTDVASKWFEWQSQLDRVKEISIPRCYFSNSSVYTALELHIFVDASIDAYAAVSYWRKIHNNGVDVSFICGKSRVAPRKMLSVPRMELQAGVLGTRMKESILNNHSIKPSAIYFWTDSKTLLQWINSESRAYKPFVAHRIAEILESSSENSWYWIPTHLNVADDATRAKLPSTIENNSRWLNGPTLLYNAVIEIPPQPIDLKNAEISDELRPTARKMLIIKPQPIVLIPNLNNFSRYIRLKRAIAWFFRAVKIFLSKIGRLEKSSKYESESGVVLGSCGKPRVYRFDMRLLGELSVHELDLAELHLYRMVQQEVFSNDYSKLKYNEVLNPDDQLYNLTPYVDENDLIRINGRIDAATDVPIITRRPIILPKCHKLTDLIIAHHHEELQHANHETVICRIRQKFWIPQIRQRLNTIRNRCQRCLIDNAKPKQPSMGPLPYDRLAGFVRPFTYTGLDYFGPIYVAIGRRREKRWAALFTCLTIRAIHLEVSTDLSTDACIICLRNFFNIRGIPKRIRSDNGTNFIGVRKELANVTDFFDIDTIERELSNFGIEWMFNSPHDPSAGGVWERLVRSVKRSLYATLKDRVPKEDTLRSVLLEAANIVNSRPLTHVPVSSESEEPLTPNHFLIGVVNSTSTPGPVNEKLFCLKKQWRISQQMKNHFYKRWIDEYLPILTRRSKWFQKAPPIAINDLVLICEVDMPRSKWNRGRVVKVFEGKDGQVRSAEIKTVQGILKRPANKLAVLEVANLDDSREGECKQENSNVTQNIK